MPRSREQKQHEEMYRKLLMRRRLLVRAPEGAAYVPFIGDGDIAAELYTDRQVYGADLDPARCETAQERMPSACIKVADCDHWPFPDVDQLFAVADFDSYADPYGAFRAFWANALKTPAVVLYFTDGHRLEMTRRGNYIRPDGRHVRGLSLNESRRVFNSYFVTEALPYLVRHIAPWRVTAKAYYLRGQMLYWGAVVSRG